MSTLVVADAGSCHDGQLDRMRALVDAAANASADVLKVQYWSDPDQLADRRRVPAFVREAYRRWRLPREWLEVVRDRCRQRGVRFGVTTYLPQDVAAAARYADVLKVASFEAECRDLLAAHAPFVSERVPLVVSLGMGARPRFEWAEVPWRHARFLRCVSAYPAPAEALGLCRLWPRDVYDGLSDHTDPALTWTGALAVAAGATVVEAHLKLEVTAPQNPDAGHAMLPQQFYEYVRHIRFAERCVGQAGDGMEPCEAEMARYRAR